jgi:hypothetical protein
MPLEMLALDGVEEGGVSIPAQDQLFTRGVRIHVFFFRFFFFFSC